MSTYSPDVLITPSKLAPLAKDVAGTLVINPGLLVKGTSGGTYADVNIHPISADELREAGSRTDAVSLKHNVPSRSFVNILRI